MMTRLSDGTCAEPGDPLGSASDYADLEADAEGDATAQAEVSGALAEDGDYVVLVTDESGEDPVTAACGALEHE